MHMIKMK